jgi:hypothetical protein
LEAPLHRRAGRVGIDLHLGQNPMLGGRYADDTLIYILYFVGPLYIHVSLSLLFSLLFLLSKTQKDQKSKNILLCLLFPSVLVSKIKNPKIFVVLLWFCKVYCRVQSPVTPLELGIHFILFKPHK